MLLALLKYDVIVVRFYTICYRDESPENWKFLVCKSSHLSRRTLGRLSPGPLALESSEEIKASKTYHRTTRASSGQMLDAWAVREEQQFARIMAEQMVPAPLVAKVHCNTDCELFLFPYQASFTTSPPKEMNNCVLRSSLHPRRPTQSLS